MSCHTAQSADTQKPGSQFLKEMDARNGVGPRLLCRGRFDAPK